ncbi:pilus assembly protein [Georgenia sp. MJ170]|uniref:pilus assembly protein n=1 Tax=Georgenia sunbinii TaxID=3117728 RepID=UPI002F26D91C
MRWGSAVRRLAARLREDEGSAVVEFIGVTVVLLIPLVYLVLTLGRVQAAMFAAEAAARESGRIISQAEDLEAAAGRARSAVELAFADQGIVVDANDVLRLTCDEDPCLSRGARIHVQVDAAVRLPLVPDFLAGTMPMEVPVRAEHLAVVPEFGVAP